MMRSSISRPLQRDLSCHPVLTSVLRNSSSPQSPMPRRCAWQAVESNGDASAVWCIHSLPEPPRPVPDTSDRSATRFYRHPYIDALQTGLLIERHLSRISPAFPRSLASVLIPRPAALAALLRCAALRVWVSKQKSPAQHARGCGPECGRDFSSEPPQKARLRPWERGTLPPQHAQNVCRGPRDLASLRARVSRGQSGQIQSGEKQWHFTTIA